MYKLASLFLVSTISLVGCNDFDLDYSNPNNYVVSDGLNHISFDGYFIDTNHNFSFDYGEPIGNTGEIVDSAKKDDYIFIKRGKDIVLAGNPLYITPINSLVVYLMASQNISRYNAESIISDIINPELSSEMFIDTKYSNDFLIKVSQKIYSMTIELNNKIRYYDNTLSAEKRFMLVMEDIFYSLRSIVDNIDNPSYASFIYTPIDSLSNSYYNRMISKYRNYNPLQNMVISYRKFKDGVVVDESDAVSVRPITENGINYYIFNAEANETLGIPVLSRNTFETNDRVYADDVEEVISSCEYGCEEHYIYDIKGAYPNPTPDQKINSINYFLNYYSSDGGNFYPFELVNYKGTLWAAFFNASMGKVIYNKINYISDIEIDNLNSIYSKYFGKNTPYLDNNSPSNLNSVIFEISSVNNLLDKELSFLMELQQKITRLGDWGALRKTYKWGKRIYWRADVPKMVYNYQIYETTSGSGVVIPNVFGVKGMLYFYNNDNDNFFKKDINLFSGFEKHLVSENNQQN